MPRHLVPEILDQLPFDDPDAVRSRREIQRINFMSGNYRWLERTLQELSAKQAVELGAGCGSCSKRLSQWPDPLHYTAIDLIPRPTDFPPEFEWVQGDALKQLSGDRMGGVLLANLFLHHLTDEDLGRLGEQLEGFDAIVCCEPTRGQFPHFLGYLLRLTGINHVTRYDLHASVNAGFRNAELPDALGLRSPKWNVKTEHSFLGIYRMVATRN